VPEGDEREVDPLEMVDSADLGRSSDPLVTAESSQDVLAESETPAASSETFTAQTPESNAATMQPQIVQRSRDLVEESLRDRTAARSGTEQNAAPRDEAVAQETVREARLMADGVIPSMMEGLLNQVHRKAGRDRKEAARLLLIILKAHGAYVYEHCTRLVDLAMSLGHEMGDSGQKLEQEIEQGMTYRDLGEVAFFLTKRSVRQRDALTAYLAGVDLAQESMLHDVGKIHVPEEILYKPGPLNERERRIMERHPVWGAEILQRLPPLHHAIPVTLHHHERWDGRGYPDGLAGEAIPPAARIVSVVDAFDAMVSDRPYRKALSFDEACNVIREGSGTQFEPRCAQAFLRIVNKVWSIDRQY